MSKSWCCGYINVIQAVIQQEKGKGVTACINSKHLAEPRKVSGNRLQMDTKAKENAVDCPSESAWGKNNTTSTILQMNSNPSCIENGQSPVLAWSLPFGSSWTVSVDFSLHQSPHHCGENTSPLALPEMSCVNQRYRAISETPWHFLKVKPENVHSINFWCILKPLG